MTRSLIGIFGIAMLVQIQADLTGMKKLPLHKMTILSVENVTIIREPMSHTYTKQADKSAHPHVPFSFLDKLNPLNWTDRKETIDAYSLLLKDVLVEDENHTKKKLAFVLIRHAGLSTIHFTAYDQIKEYVVDNTPAPGKTYNGHSGHNKVYAISTLWYRDTPVPLATFTRDEKDKGTMVIPSHILIQKTDVNEYHNGKWKSLPKHMSITVGEYGKFVMHE